MERMDDLMEELIDCVLNDENSNDMIKEIREVFSKAKNADKYRKALQEIQSIKGNPYNSGEAMNMAREAKSTAWAALNL